MTVEEMDNMTVEERKEQSESVMRFDECMSIEEYTESIRDELYIWRHIVEKRENYTIEDANRCVKNNEKGIQKFYDEKISVSDAAVDVDFCCG